MKIENANIFFGNLDYLFDLAKEAGVNKREAAELMGFHRSTGGKWKERGAIRAKFLNNIVRYFDKYTRFPLTPDLLLSKDLKRIECDGVGEEKPLYLSAEESALIRRLRDWKVVNRQALIKFVMEAYL